MDMRPRPAEYSPDLPELIVFDERIRSLYRDLQVLLEIVQTHNPTQSGIASRALWIANSVINLFDNANPERIDWTAIDKHIDDFFGKGQYLNKSIAITAVGHCHIDAAWLWTFSETQRKCARSWAAQIALMDAHPDYVFVCSQMQELDWIRQSYPSLFQRIQTKAKTGQFIPIGGSWVEMDGNMPSGESYIRQFLLGQRFIREHFDGMTSRIFWLPGTCVLHKMISITFLQIPLATILSFLR